MMRVIRSNRCCDVDALVNVVVELVVTGVRQQHAEARSKREEDLSGSVNPHLQDTCTMASPCYNVSTPAYMYMYMYGHVCLRVRTSDEDSFDQSGLR